MSKIALVVHRVAELTRSDFHARLEAAHSRPSVSPHRHTIHLPYETDALRAEPLRFEPQPARCDAVSFRWNDDPAIVTEEPRAAISRVDAYRVDEVIHWDRLPRWPTVGRSPGVKMMAFVRGLPELSPEEFRDRYLQHADVAREHHPGIARYVQNFVTEALTEGVPALSAIAELHFETESDLTERFYRDDASPKAVADDVHRFMRYRGSWSILATEIVVA